MEFLEENSEWEKFTVAFFGETNAGKSTIIESLRILLNEKERERVIVKNNGNIENIEQEFTSTIVFTDNSGIKNIQFISDIKPLDILNSYYN